ncbi:MAG: YihY/virulence factor BrkB family protein [Kineosporiaceae bacterium]
MWTRYGRARGGVLAAGVAYYAFFSLVPALAVGFTILGIVLGGRADLQADVVSYLNDNLGTTLVSVHEGQGALVTLDDLTGSGALSATGVFGVVGLLLTGLGWAGAIRAGVRGVFGVPGGTNVVVDRLRDVLLMAALGVAVLASVALSLSVTTLADAAQAWLGVEQTQAGATGLQVGAAVLVLGVDALVLAVLVRIMAATSPRWRDLWPACLLGATALGLLKLFGGLLLGRTASSRFVTAFAVVVGLLIWMNVAGRIVLLTAAWAADRSQRGVLPVSLLTPAERHRDTPAQAGALLPAPPCPPPGPAVPVAAADAVAVSAGAVLGAVAGWTAARLVGTATSRGPLRGPSRRRG